MHPFFNHWASCLETGRAKNTQSQSKPLFCFKDLYAKICKGTIPKRHKIVQPNYTNDDTKTRPILKFH